MGVVNLQTVIPQQGFRIDGVSTNQYVTSAAIACDLDEDGINEAILGNALYSSNQGRVQVIWGSPFNTVKPNTTSDIVPPLGFNIFATTTYQYVGASLACVDINQDGHQELVIGAYGYQRAPTDTPGAVYVIYFNGTRLTNTITVESLTPSQGFLIPGTANTDQFGYDMDNVGDVNGDGWDDVAVSAPYASGTGKVYVIYSQPGFNAFDISTLNTNAAAGFLLQGTTGSTFGYSLRKAGDFNNDGYADFVTGAFRSNFAGINTGSAYVIFGNATRATPTFVNSLTNMIRFDGNPSGQQPRLGYAVSSAGHFDGDAYSDIVISAPFEASPVGIRSVGYTFIIFGKSNFPSITNVNALGSDAIKIYGREEYAGLGYSLAGGKDINGDGFDDVVVGEYFSFLRAADGQRDGAAYVLFGNTLQRNTNFNINTLSDTQGYMMRNYAYGSLGQGALALGDLNNDGYPDILIASPLATVNGTTSAGIFYAISGRLAPVLTTSNTTVSYTEDAVPVLVDSAITVIDHNNPTLASAKISISQGFTNGDILRFVDQNGITGQYNAGTGTLTLTGVASVEDYETALRSITFETDNISFSNRTISFTANNGAVDSTPVTRSIPVVSLQNLLTGSGSNVLCLNQENSQLVFPHMSIVGGNELTLQNATVTIADVVASEDSLTFTSLNPQISGNYDNSTGILTLTGPATASDFEAILRTIEYQNSNITSISNGKNITVTVNYEGQTSNAIEALVDLITANDAPMVINPVPDFNVTAAEPFSVVLPANTFNVPDTELNLSVTGEHANSTSLSFDSNTRRLNGTLPVGHNRFRFFGADTCDQLAVTNFTINAVAAPAAPPISIPEVIPSESAVSAPEADRVGSLVGGLVGGIGGGFLLLIGGFVLWRKKRNKAEDDDTTAPEAVEAAAIAPAVAGAQVHNNPLYKKHSWYNRLYRSLRNLVSTEKSASAAALPVVVNEAPVEMIEKSASSHRADSSSETPSASTSNKSVDSSKKSSRADSSNSESSSEQSAGRSHESSDSSEEEDSARSSSRHMP